MPVSKMSDPLWSKLRLYLILKKKEKDSYQLVVGFIGKSGSAVFLLFFF